MKSRKPPKSKAPEALRIVVVAPDLVVSDPDDEHAKSQAERSRALRIGLLENGFNLIATLPGDVFLADRINQLQPDLIIVDAESEAREARRVRDEAKKCLRHASFQLGKAAYEIDEFLKEFSTARIPIRRQVILNEAIAHLVTNVLPNLGIAEMARVQVQLALRDYVKSSV
jgi:hypothetical protein